MATSLNVKYGPVENLSGLKKTDGALYVAKKENGRAELHVDFGTERFLISKGSYVDSLSMNDTELSYSIDNEQTVLGSLAPLNKNKKIELNYLYIDTALNEESENLLPNSLISQNINSLNNSLTNLSEDTASRFIAVEDLISQNEAAIEVLKAADLTHDSAINILNQNVSTLQTEINNKINKEELEWATYVDNTSVSLGVPGSTFKISLDNNQIALSQGNNSAIFNNNTFTANSLAATSSITLGGLVFTNEGDAGYSIM